MASDPGSNRLIFSDEANVPGLRIAYLDLDTGALRWDESVTYAGGEPGISFARESWPHGATGPAYPHGVAFGN